MSRTLLGDHDRNPYPRRAVHVDEHTIELDGAPVFYRSAGEAAEPVLYLHGSPTSSDDWVGMLERTGGIAPDLLGFGRTGKAGHRDYTLRGHADFIEWLLAELQIERVTLVAHDWGAGGGLVFAQRHPERIVKLALIDALQLLEGFEYGRAGRMWRTAALGELAIGSVTRWVMKRALTRATVNQDIWTDERLREVFDQFDQGTQRAILRLHRATGPRELVAAGLELGELDMPALVLWGEQDPWLAASWADAYRERLPNATAARAADAGHWPWLERPKVAEQLAAFVQGD
jgi:pimeloyl-ACP methyl ester carboxylesterase